MPSKLKHVEAMNYLIDLACLDRRDLSLRQLAVLAICGALNAPQTVRELAKVLDATKPSISRAIDKLERAGCVQRLPDPRDRRSVLIALTDRGASFLSVPKIRSTRLLK